MVSVNNMRTTYLFLFLLCFLLCSFQARLAPDVLSAGQNITGDTSRLVSAGQKFVLGFFSPPDSPTERYLGIWYNPSSYSEHQRTVVWVANRDNPVVGSNGVFQMTSDGKLVVTNASGVIYWSSKLEGSSFTNRTVMRLLDSGNLVLIDGQDNGTNYIWQSFQHPTDTFLPGMKMDTDLKLTCWNTSNSPRSGSYIFTMMAASDEGNPYYITNNSSSLPHWKGGGNLNMGPKFSSVDYMLSNFSKSTYTGPSGGSPSPYKTIGCQPRARANLSYDDTRIVMNYTGELQFQRWDGVQSEWIPLWKAPASSCDVYKACGHFTSCNSNIYGGSKTPPCRCLPGFSEVVGGVRDHDCVRKSEASSSYSCGEVMTRFLSLTVGTAEMGIPDITVSAENEWECKRKCLGMCSSCQAYSYAAPPPPPCATIHDDIIVNDTTNCRIWIDGLDTIQEEYPYGDDNDDDGRKLFVRVYKSDIEPTPRTCEPCGTKNVPYPLSTGRNCGDPKYFNFICNNLTGELRFFTTNAAAANTSSSDGFTVTSMEVKSRKFVIRIDASVSDCEQAKQMIRPPFNVSTDCIVDNRVEVTWQPPLEPICNKSADCEGWSNSICKETKDGIKRCLCDSPYHWDNVNLNCTRGLPADSKGPKAKWLIAGITLTSVVILTCAIIFAYVFRRKITLKKEKKRNQRNREHFHDSVRHVKDLIEVGGLEEEDNEGIEVPYFDFESILVATDNFSDANKLGKGGYGPVYKGNLQSGEVVAVKRLSSVSSQGLQEFKNEVVLIAKLQHRNLVRLRGYCIKGNEKILLYEYMHNKSLDSFIFDPTKSQLLNWQMRFDIILGVARGMLYLHRDSRLTIIHRDLKISNILLNEEMQPKISDFGLAKIVASKETEANTRRVVGTYGYMSPEYALDGLFSTKSDVFSFGVVMLEIISGKKNTGFYNSEQFSSLLSFAWILWTEDRLLDLMDMSLGESCNTSQFVRCAHIGLLCVQDEPGDRPTMSNVVTLLDSETSILSTPKQPTFFANRGQSITTSSSKPEITMQFESSSQEVEYNTMGL